MKVTQPKMDVGMFVHDMSDAFAKLYNSSEYWKNFFLKFLWDYDYRHNRFNFNLHYIIICMFSITFFLFYFIFSSLSF